LQHVGRFGIDVHLCVQVFHGLSQHCCMIEGGVALQPIEAVAFGRSSAS